MQEVEKETSGKIPSLKKLSHAGMQELRNKNLRYYCDKKVKRLFEGVRIVTTRFNDFRFYSIF